MGDRASADSLRWNLDLALDQRGADMADLPGGASGMLVRGYKGKEADLVVTGIEPGVVSLVAEQGGHERQAAEELGEWKTRGEERKAVDPRRRWSPWPCSLRGGARWIWNGGRWNRRRRWSPRRDRRSGAGARDQPDGCGPHPPRGERPGVEQGCASTCRPTFPIKLERTSRGGTEARLADTSSRHTRSRTAARRCRATRSRRRCADRASRGARLFHPHPSSEPK